MKKKQLYTVYENVSIPDHVRYVGGAKFVKFRVVKRLAFLSWPNGKPCVAANHWLTSVSSSTTGSTTATYAAHVSHLIRFCFSKKISFHQLSDGLLHELVEDLICERSREDPSLFARHNNHVRQIIRTCISFLFWYQDNFFVGRDGRLIGVLSDNPKIVVKLKRTSRVVYFEHSSLPPKEALQSDKNPMPDEYIERIQDEILRRREISEKGAGSSDLVNQRARYIYERRIFVVWIMKRTGLRPEEMHEIPVHENANVLAELRIKIPTKKRRRNTPPVRSFPIMARDAMHFTRYMRAREAFTSFLKVLDPGYIDCGALLLNEHGRAVRKESLTKDFERLSKGAGLESTKSCFSMFRHRFITREIVVHLKEFMSGGSSAREMMTDAVLKSIAKRIASKTGHGSPESIWAYFDIAWDYIGLWGSADAALLAIDSMESVKEELVRTRHDVAMGDVNDFQEIKKRLISLERELESIKSSVVKGVRV
ncbi:hypothetical protein SAMN05216229_104275 [Geopseudomonas sagittaria]|uniref:Phage integrase family protein n=1 Tax=Geopseudomonas sagittaria TaxID=1135990 RepID=A0A1I5SA95_9GAMM|nr:hypothetical protein [Pseudomonas sagittaria]SFP67684.1 hypothetical protein SAMN05216229_104275 [Pseudomonas sagittaria]